MRDREVDFILERPANKVAAVETVARQMKTWCPSREAILARSMPPVSDRDRFQLAVAVWLFAPLGKRRGQRGREHRERPLDRSGWVYFVAGGDLIKIGTSNNVQKRFAALRTSSPVPLALLLAIPGSRDLETRLHLRFEPIHSHGEWFRAEPSLVEYIERLRSRQQRRSA